MAADLVPSFCLKCGNTFGATAALDAHQMETGHEMNQEDHPLRQPPTVWVLSAGEDHEGGNVLGVYASKDVAKGPFVEAARRIPFDLDKAWQDDDTEAVHAHGGCDWVSLEPHPLIAREQL